MHRKWLQAIRKSVNAWATPVRPKTYHYPEAVRMRECLARGSGKLDPDTPLHKLRFVVLDTETTGFAPYGGDEVIEIGAVTVENGRPHPEQIFRRLVNPGRAIPIEVCALTGITPEQVAEADDLCTVLLEFLPFLDDACLIGHHLGFDLEFLNLKLRRFCGQTIRNPGFDTLNVAKALYPHLGSYSLDALLSAHGIEPAGRHTALGDAWLTARLFSMQLELLDVMRIKTLGELQAFLKLREDHSMALSVPSC
jgi:DNA polymerase-3 subunit epsilon